MSGPASDVFITVALITGAVLILVQLGRLDED